MTTDTGAREPQACAKALLQMVEGLPDTAKVTLFVCELRILANDVLALAAGVGVPPDADETLLDLAVVQSRDREDNGERITLVELIRSQGFDPAEFGVADEPAGVGEARPAEPTTLGGDDEVRPDPDSRGPEDSERHSGDRRPAEGRREGTADRRREEPLAGAPAEEQPDARAGGEPHTMKEWRAAYFTVWEQLDAARQALETVRYERDAVYAVNAAANYDRANAAEDALQEIVALCEPDRIPLPLLNSQILRVARAALGDVAAGAEGFSFPPDEDAGAVPAED